VTLSRHGTVFHGIINKPPICDSYTVTYVLLIDLTASPWWRLFAWTQTCASLNHLRVMKAEPSRLIPRKLACKPRASNCLKKLLQQFCLQMLSMWWQRLSEIMQDRLSRNSTVAKHVHNINGEKSTTFFYLWYFQTGKSVFAKPWVRKYQDYFDIFALLLDGLHRGNWTVKTKPTSIWINP